MSAGRAGLARVPGGNPDQTSSVSDSFSFRMVRKIPHPCERGWSSSVRTSAGRSAKEHRPSSGRIGRCSGSSDPRQRRRLGFRRSKSRSSRGSLPRGASLSGSSSSWTLHGIPGRVSSAPNGARFMTRKVSASGWIRKPDDVVANVGHPKVQCDLRSGSCVGSGISRSAWTETDHRPALGRKIRGKAFRSSGSFSDMSILIWRASGNRRASPSSLSSSSVRPKTPSPGTWEPTAGCGQDRLKGTRTRTTGRR